MRKIFIALVLMLTVSRSFADEGMWLPLLLGQQVYNDMVKKGLKLSKDQLYSINKASLKDAIVIFGTGCTGELVSPQGLIFTNHHCGYAVIAGASTMEHNFLRDGFYARNNGEEIPGGTLSDGSTGCFHSTAPARNGCWNSIASFEANLANCTS